MRGRQQTELRKRRYIICEHDALITSVHTANDLELHESLQWSQLTMWVFSERASGAVGVREREWRSGRIPDVDSICSILILLTWRRMTADFKGRLKLLLHFRMVRL
jgi:hypothetical protein